jgi:outer membrane protein TolC
MYSTGKTHIVILIFIILAHFCLPVGSFAQSDDESDEVTIVFDPLVDNIQDKLPPLEVLIDSAVKNAPRIRLEDAAISIARYKVQEYKRAWTKDLSFLSSFSYGNLYQFSTSETAGGLPTEFLSIGTRTNFTVGVSLRMPLFDILNRTNSINQGKREIESHVILKEQMKREPKQAVIFSYQALLLHQDLLKVKNEAQITSSIQVKMAEKEFLNGKISISDLARVSQTHAVNLYSYKQDRMLFFKQYLLLEELVGMKFNLLNEIY